MNETLDDRIVLSERRSYLDLSAVLTSPVFALVAVCTVLELVSGAGWVDPLALPPPSDIGSGMFFLVRQEFFWTSFKATFVETAAGFAIGSGVGLLIGALTGSWLLLRRAFYPLVVMFQSFPKSALAPLFVVWFGFGLASKILLAATFAFFPVVVNMVSAFDATADDAKLLMQGYGASKIQCLTKLSFRDSLPAVFAGLKTGITLALVGAIVAEFVGALEGLGTLLETFSFSLQMDLSFATLVYLALLGLMLYLLIDFVERKVVFWRGRS